MHDVAVVGAGHNGLVCAGYLARAGLDLVILESREDVGGCAATVDALDARVNVCNCDHLLVRGTPIAEELELERHGLRYLEAEPVQVALGWSGAAPWLLFRDVDRTLESLRSAYAGEVGAYRRYLDAALPAARLVLELANDPPTPRQAAAVLLRRRARGAATLLAWGRRSADSVLRSYFRQEALLAPAAVIGPVVAGLPPQAPRTGLGALGYAMRHAVPMGRPVGGSGALVAALAQAVRASGGLVRTGTKVDEIVVEHGRVRGVVLVDGEEVRARAVVVACDPRAPRVRWVGGEPPPGGHRWRSRPGREGYQSKIDAVIGMLPRYRRAGAEEGAALAATVVVAPDTDALAESYRAMGQGVVAPQPPHLVNIPSVLDETMRLPSGDHVLSLETLFTPYALVDGWSADRARAEASRWLESFASLLEPGFLDDIRRWRVVTPEDYERDFGHPRGGAQSYGVRPLAALAGRDRDLTRYETPVAGLYLTGVATYPGGGIWGAPGRNAAAVVARALGA